MKHAKPQGARMAVGAVVVVAIKRLQTIKKLGLAACTLGAMTLGAQAAVLPEDRADLLIHVYDGGGVTVEGPSILVRKNIKDTVSVYANYYTDMVSSASIDVLTSGSKYSEQRTEVSTGADYLHDNSILSIGVTNSSENDYEANTLNLGLSQDFFGDLTTLTMGYVIGDDTVMMNTKEEEEVPFERSQKHQRFNIGISQVVTKNWLLAATVESVIDRGFLNNPYRQVRFYNGANIGYDFELYPQSHNSDAIALRSIYYLPFRASVKAEAKAFNDSWGVKAKTFELRYVHPIQRRWTFEAKARSYSQTQADFYADIFPRAGSQSFYARDKELSTFDSVSFGLGVTYQIQRPWFAFIDKSSLNLYWDNMQFSYDNFRNATLSKAPDDGSEATYKPGEEPLYSFDANVIRLFFSAQY